MWLPIAGRLTWGRCFVGEPRLLAKRQNATSSCRISGLRLVLALRFLRQVRCLYIPILPRASLATSALDKMYNLVQIYTTYMQYVRCGVLARASRYRCPYFQTSRARAVSKPALHLHFGTWKKVRLATGRIYPNGMRMRVCISPAR